MDRAEAACGDAHDCRRNPSFKSMDNGPLPEENLLPPCEPQTKEVSSTGYVLISCQKLLSHKVLVKWLSNSLIKSTFV